MLLALAMLNICHPGRVLTGPNSEYKAGKKEFKAERKAAKKAKKSGHGKYDVVDGEENSFGLQDLRERPAGQPESGASGQRTDGVGYEPYSSRV